MNYWTHDEYSKFITSLYEIPKNITNEWMDSVLSGKEKYNGASFASRFSHFGVCYRDLRDCDLSKLDKSHLKKLAFNSSTIFPSADKLPSDFNPKEILLNGKNPMLGIKDLHASGIDGRGITVAVIDFGFQDSGHVEFAGSNIEVVDLFGDTDYHFHADGVLSNLCGQNIGVAPKAKVYHYNTYQGHGEKVDKATLKILSDILDKVKSGIKIRVVNISAPLSRDSRLLGQNMPDEQRLKLKEEIEKPFLSIIEQLKTLGCEVVSSERFSQTFSCCDVDFSTKKLDKPEWLKTKRAYSDFVCFVSGGRVIPEFTSKDGYEYETTGAYSWTIPQAIGMYCLALQENNNLTWEDFAKICKDTSTLQDGVRLASPKQIIEKARQMPMENGNC
mgnify:CR=1 FL=1